MKIVICSSAAFYQHAIEVKTQLEALGFEVVVPKTALTMQQNNDFNVEHYKTWFGNADDYDKKADFMRSHFDQISAGDAILVVNDEKNGIDNYIGANVLLEMSLAWYQQKPIYILNGLPENSAYEEEIKGMMPIVLEGDMTKLEKDTHNAE